MGRLDFNTYEFLRALSIASVDLVESKHRFQEYIGKYPRDYSAYAHYAVTLIMLCELEEAEKVLELVNYLVLNNKNFRGNTYSKFIANYNFARIKLLCYQGKMQELYREYIIPNYHIDEFATMDINMLRDNQNLSNIDLQAISFWCLKKLGMLDINNRSKYRYLFRQIIKYYDDDFMQHIQKHLSAFNLNAEVPNPVIFQDDFPITEVIDTIKGMIPNENVVFSGFFEDLYTFKFDECGRVDGKITNYFQVVSLHGTDQLITMYPANNCENFPCIDLNYLNNNRESSKVKVKSQIDKFNSRYGNK